MMHSSVPVPLVDLHWQHSQIAHEVEAGFAEVLASAAFVGGPPVRRFEVQYADTVGVPYCIGVANGTDALELALRALGVAGGDEVILPAMTFVATAEAVVRCGATPVLVDVDPDYLLLDPDRLEQLIGRRTRAVVPVHLHGQMAPMERIVDLAGRHGAFVVEDAAQSQGATQTGRAAGAFGDAAGTSFYPGKNLGAYGDAGAVLTTAEDVAQRVRLLANHGEASRYDHVTIGMNSRLDTLQAVVLGAKLSRLSDWNALRVDAARRYDDLLAGQERIARPQAAPANTHVWHLYAVRVEHRDRVLRHLHDAGIGAGVHYPRPVHLHPAFASLGHGAGAFPVAEAAAASMVSLPLFPGITEAQQQRVVDVLVEAVG